MIRALKEKDMDRVMEIWLDSNVDAHPFIPAGFWQSNYENVKKALPDALVYVYEDDNQLLGFIGLTGHYIAGIFVRDTDRSRGIGGKLLNYVMQRTNKLSLHVYQKNTAAVKFYRREGFETRLIQTDEPTGELELLMSWTR